MNGILKLPCNQIIQGRTMITNENLLDLLKCLNFEEKKGIFTKRFKNGVILSVDYNNGILVYPEDKGLIVHERQTCNFSSNENFVVFECVHRLIAKGYKPEHIELEPKWQLGHGASGGRADILIKDNYGKSLLIIECKTDGKEFNDAWRSMVNGPTQLFSYAQQVRSTQFVCLYSSDFEGIDSYKNYIVTLRDNEKLLLELADKEPLSYKNAQEIEDIFKVWKHTYAQDAATKGIFEDEIQAYHIGKLKFSLKDLKTVASKDIQGKYHEFATILRQHNVSGRENAFDKLVNLFLCKVVDESEHPNDLQFYWKGIAYDNYFDLIDRLQRLYKIGMDKFLEEEVTYVDEKSIDDAFRYFKNDKDATKDTIKNYFRQLKFFTNSDFAFIDVHNENLFYQNSEVLLKIVKMLQDIRLKTDEQNQFLGDMFEGFLDQGVKQSEGQFFTPMPIVRFILSSLPHEQIILQNEIPKVIDYACGAGHFLNEYATQIKPIVESTKKASVTEYYREIIGIEKEYRLSKVAKVSAFMYGQDDINIVYSDALAENPAIKDGSFSVLVANPPYSVKGFLETLKPTERKHFELINTIESKSYPNNNSIEAFFIERAKQLLKPGGVAAIIVPASIISKGTQKNTSKKQNVYVATRELILKYFDIIAVAEFGKGTFGKTGTNTVTLFLRRRTENPSLAEQYKIRVDAWFNDDDSKDGIFEDEHYLKLYCDHIEIEFEEYKTLLQKKPSENLLKTELFLMYIKEFEKTTEVLNRKKQSTFKAMSQNEQKNELDNLFLDYVHKIEKDKLYFYILASKNGQEVIILKAPTDSTAEKKFLGYEWSGKKGNEGIKYIGAAKVEPEVEKDMAEDDDSGIVILEEEDKRILGNILNLLNIQTPLYDPKDSKNVNKVNNLIRANFNNEVTVIPEHLKAFVTKSRVVDMLDFHQRDFSKTLRLIPSTSKDKIISKWPLDKLGAVADIQSGGTPSSDVPEYWDGDIPWATLVDTKEKYLTTTQRKITKLGLKESSAKLLPVNTVIFSSRASIGEVTIAKVETATNQGFKNFICNESKIRPEFLYEILKFYGSKIADLASGMTFKEISKETISNFKVPVPPPDVQDKMITLFKAVDQEVLEATIVVRNSKVKIEEEINKLYAKDYTRKKLTDPSIALINPSKREIANLNGDTIVSFVEMASVSEDGYIVEKENRSYSELKKGSYTYFKDDDIIIAKITPCMENGFK